MLFDYCLFYQGRFIPSHGEVHSVFIRMGGMEKNLLREERENEEERIVCNYCVPALLAENEKKSKGNRV